MVRKKQRTIDGKDFGFVGNRRTKTAAKISAENLRGDGHTHGARVLKRGKAWGVWVERK